MKIIGYAILAGLMAACMTGCATHSVVLIPSAVPESSAYVQFVDTTTIKFETKSFSAVASARVYISTVSVHVMFTNLSDHPVSFGPDNVQLFENGTALRRINPNDLSDVIEQKAQNYAASANGFASAQADDEQTYDAISAQGGPANPNEHPRAEQRYTNALSNAANDVGYDSAMAQGNQNRANRLDNLSQKVVLNSLKDCIMPSCGVKPKQTDEGTVYFDAPQKWPATVRVTSGGDSVKADFNPPPTQQ